MLLSLEDELAVLDLRYADLLQSVQTLACSDDEDVAVRPHLAGLGHQKTLQSAINTMAFC